MVEGVEVERVEVEGDRLRGLRGWGGSVEVERVEVG